MTLLYGTSWREANEPRNRRERRASARLAMMWGMTPEATAAHSGLPLHTVRKIQRGASKAIYRRFRTRMHNYQAEFYRAAFLSVSENTKGRGLTVDFETRPMPGFARGGYVDPRKHGTGRLTGSAPEEQRFPMTDVVVGKVGHVHPMAAVPFDEFFRRTMEQTRREFSLSMDHRLDAARLQAIRGRNR